MSLTYEAVARPLNLIYEAALEPQRWHEALSQVAELIGANCFHLCGWNTDTATDSLGVLKSSHWQPALDSYTAHYAAADPRRQVADTLRAGRWMVCNDHFDERHVSRSALWQDHLIPWGLRYTLCSTLTRSGPQSVVIAFMRDRLPFQNPQDSAANVLLPHLQRASALMLQSWQHTDRGNLGDSASELTHLALLTLTADGHLLHANPRAESLLRRQTLLRSQAGTLHAADPHADARLQSGIKAVARGGAPQHLSLRAAQGQLTWITLMRPSAAHAATLPVSRTSVLCVVAEGRRRLPSVQQLIQGFGLSPAEARVARTLAQGGTLDDCAQAHGVSRNTVKTQLAQALVKMEVSDLRELARLMGALPAVRE